MNFLLSLLFLACVWDEDTIDDEIRGVPSAEVLITNRWFRHDDIVYRRRIEKLSEKSELSLDELDTLAMAYERLGERARALDILGLKREALISKPDTDHQYRFHANRGTVLAHTGDFDGAIQELERAIAINPDAHFGREKFQVLAIRYIRDAKANSDLWAEHNFLSYAGFSFEASDYGLVRSFRDRTKGGTPLNPEEAYEAVGGMLRFGGQEGAELYRTLGDILACQGHKTLAWWFYKYALEKGHPATEELNAAIGAIHENWEAADFRDLPTQADFDAVYQDGQRWLKWLQALERSRIRGGYPSSTPEFMDQLVSETDEAVPPLDLISSKPVKVVYQDPTAKAVAFTATCGLLFIFFLIRFVVKVRRWR